MNEAAPPPSGVLVVRVWLEDRTPDGFRARISEARPGSREHVVLTTISPSEVLTAVRRWVDEFLGETGERR